MSKRYTEELAEWAEKRAKKKRRQDAVAVAFLAVKANVSEAMAAGYALTTIYEHMHETGRIKCSYETFRRHVRRYIKAGSAALPSTNLAKREPTEQKAKPAKAKQEQPKKGGFEYNATPNKEDLI
ncbi:TraK family protein [Shewanella indica]|uniref:TraK family protein n=1 Tax=Shewanella indica TaxID=768528 RepID=A0ABU4QGR4_9GAMM|nr:TraK family protein [Shewanella indica]MDX6018615.1 TraK family protein [Shewanella indica]MDX6018658.1 TraK family protein [Shewanella indica]